MHGVENLIPTYSCSWYFLGPRAHLLRAPWVSTAAVVHSSHAWNLFTFSLFASEFCPETSGVYSILAKACSKYGEVNTLWTNGLGELMIHDLTCHPSEGQLKGHFTLLLICPQWDWAPGTWNDKLGRHSSLSFLSFLIHYPVSSWDHLLKSFILGCALGEAKLRQLSLWNEWWRDH